MKIPFCFVVFVIAVAVTACAGKTEIYLITFFSRSGEVVGTGFIEFKAPVPVVGKARGHYVLSLKKIVHGDKHTDWFYRLLEKKDRGDVEWDIRPDQPDDFRIVFDFSPGTADANVQARTSALKDGSASGVWLYSVFAGGFNGGRFEIQRK